MSSSGVIRLARGGSYFGTSAGPVQIGIPPETIKDAMSLGLDPPVLYVVPAQPFDRQAGVNVAEFEFPAYYNFFLLKRKVRLLVESEEVERRLRTVMDESLFGPGARGESRRGEEFPADTPLDARPDFVKESEFFRQAKSGGRITIDSLVDFLRFSGGKARIPDTEVEIEHLAAGGYVVRDGGKEVGRAAEKVMLPEPEITTADFKPFDPPAFGVTVLGSSHGFDPHGKTTGFVVWVGGRGIMVDPPVGSAGWLRHHGVPTKLIEGVIVTHCHADHDSGTFQRILQEGRIQVWTTPTILGSFLRKYSALSGIGPDLLRRTFTFRPVVVGEPMRIRGAEFRFFYMLHSIPTIGFEAFFGGKSVAISADTLYDPERIAKMRDDGVLGARRAEQLLRFPWSRSLVLHEAGIPPLHTPAAALAALPEEAKRNLYVVHIARKDLPKNSGLAIAPTGLENTIRLPVLPTPHGDSIELLDALSAVDLFRGFTVSGARDLLQVARRVRHPKGTKIIEQGARGEAFYVVASGEVAVLRDGEVIKLYRAGDYFGETSLVLRQPRNADVVASTDVDLVEIDAADFLYLLRGTEVVERLERLARIRDERSWDVINSNSVLRSMTSGQKTQLQTHLEVRPFLAGDVLWKDAGKAEEALLVDEGEIVLEGGDETLEPFGRGALLGEIDAILAGTTTTTTARAKSAGRAFRIARDGLLQFLQDNPGLRVSFLGTRFME